MSTQNYINHIVFVLVASSSMTNHKAGLFMVADAQIAHLAQRSKELDQETRVTVYSFADTPKCLIWDMDVLRLPSIATLYKPYGNTALIDATLLAIADLSMTPEKYGDHSFLAFVLTDGQENASRSRSTNLSTALTQLPDHWTVAALVPDARGVHEAKKFGFPADNIAVWDTTTQVGLERAVEKIQVATEQYMFLRTQGERSTRSLFSTGYDAVNAATVKAAKLTPLKKGSYFIVPVPKDSVIREFVEATGNQYKIGHTYYQLMKTETIQGNKELAVVENDTAKVFVGDGVRDMIGLGDLTVRVKPNHNPKFTIYVQSTSVNRKLLAGTKALILP
jgi:hypothetical protein